jgi:C1A family cysteine protease
MEAILQGWLDGDGWHSERGTAGVSISHDLALSMYDIAQALGKRPVIKTYPPAKTEGIKHRYPTWTVEMCAKSDNWRVEQDDKHVWRKIRAIERESYSGPVFNLSVQGDESYVAEGIGVHNCTANAIAGLLEFDMIKQKITDFVPSRLFIYWIERYLEHSVNYDAGAQLRDGMKGIARWGYPSETDWPYNINSFRVQPPHNVVMEAAKHKVTDYSRVQQTSAQLKGALAQGYPICFGFTVFQSLETPSVSATGIIPLPGLNESTLGGHAISLVGFDDSKNWYIIRNSWGTTWGAQGYGFMPYSYVENPQLSSDFWVVHTVV